MPPNDPPPMAFEPGTDALLIFLRQLRKLSAGRTTLDEIAPANVSLEDIEIGLQIADTVEAYIKTLERQTDTNGETVGVPLDTLPRGWGATVAEMHYGAALQAASSLRRLLERELGTRGRAQGSSVPPIPLEWIVKFDGTIGMSHEILRILAAEMPWEQSTYAGITTGFGEFASALADGFIGVFPVIGPIYDIGTGLIGRRLPDGGQLTNTERALRVGLPVFGALVGVVVRGARVTVNTIRVLQAGRNIGAIGTRTRRSCLALALALNKLSPQQAAKLAEIVEVAIKGTRPLSHLERAPLYRLMALMNEAGSVAGWANIAADPANVARRVGRAAVLVGVVPKPGEEAAVAALSNNLPDTELLWIPERLPHEFGQTGQRLADAAHPDLIIGTQLADVVTPVANEVKSVFKAMLKKGGQGSVVVVNLDRTAVQALEIASSIRRLWANPPAFAIQRVILLNSQGFFQVLERPLIFQGGEVLLQSAPSSLEHLRKLWEDLEREEAKSGAR